MSANPERYRYIKGVKYKLVGIENRVDTAELWAENMRGHGEKIEIISIPEGYALYREESLDWHSLDPKDKSAVLQEQKNQIEAGGPLCQALDDIADEFTSYIIEEGDASRNYGQYADKFKEMNLPTWQGALSYMSHDESEHREILKIIVDVIKEKCRCH